MLEVRALPDALQKLAHTELNEDPKRIPEAFDQINEWLEKQPHLNIRKDDQIMMAFFRGCKWNIQKVKEKLDSFYSAKSLFPDFFKDRDPLSLATQRVLEAGIVVPLPKVKNYSGPVIIIFNLSNIDVTETPITQTGKLFFMTLDILMKEDDDFVVSGVVLLNDHSECPASCYLQFTPTVVQNYITCFQNIYPVRIKNCFLINTLTVFDVIYNTMIRPFLSTKIKQRVIVTNSAETSKFLKQLPQNVLPEEYGGTNGTLQSAAEQWKTKVESYRDWFLEDHMYGTNEQLRIPGGNLFESGVGVDGTFRSLSID